MRRLTIRNAVGRLLELDNLLVGEIAAIVNNLHGVGGSADWSWALGGFLDFAPIEAYRDGVVADSALEKGLLHVRHDGSGPNDKSFDADKPIKICIAC